jgi:hypothetical protein
MKEFDLAYDWIDMAALLGGASFLTVLIYSVTLL